jgi:hypothetical protein
MGPKLPLARSTVPDDALVEDGADDAAGALAPVVVCLLELPLPHAATAIALKATAVAAASGARRVLPIVCSFNRCAVSRGIATVRVAPRETKLWPRGAGTYMSDARPA